MQKKIIALAVAGLVSGAAFAQSNVTIYGVADAAYIYESSKKNDDLHTRFSGIESGGWSGSRIGFKGEEGLGNGLKAIFTMEYGTKLDGADGNGALGAARQSYVGFAGANWGQVSIGRQYAPSYDWYGNYSSNAVTGNYALDVLYPAYINKGLGGTMTTDSNARWNNSVKYLSPIWNGLQAQAIYAFGEQEGEARYNNAEDNSRFGAGVNYSNGGLGLLGVYQTRIDVANTNKGTDEWLLGASYDFKAVKVFATWQETRARYLNANGNGSTPKADIWSVGATVPVSAAGKVMLEYAHAKARGEATLGTAAAALNINLTGVSDGARSNAYSLGYSHDLSKRTMLYTSVAYISNNDNAGVSYKDTAGFGQNAWSYQAGVRHQF